MKRLLFLCVLLVTISANAYAINTEIDDDKTGTISGKVLDASLKQPLPYVNIIIKNTEGKTLTGGITLDDGTFKIDKIAEGKISINIQYIGYKTYVKEITIEKGNYNIDVNSVFL